MIDFKTINVEMRTRETSGNIERRIEGGHESAVFKTGGVISGSATLNFDSPVQRSEGAIKSFHFQTQDDHNIEKLKLETQVNHSGNRVTVSCEGVFMDDSPEDDFVNKPFIMSASVLVLVDRN